MGPTSTGCWCGFCRSHFLIRGNGSCLLSSEPRWFYRDEGDSGCFDPDRMVPTQPPLNLCHGSIAHPCFEMPTHVWCCCSLCAPFCVSAGASSRARPPLLYEDCLEAVSGLVVWEKNRCESPAGPFPLCLCSSLLLSAVFLWFLSHLLFFTCHSLHSKHARHVSVFTLDWV